MDGKSQYSDTIVDHIQNLSSASAQSCLNDLAFQYIYSPSAIDKDYSRENGRRWFALETQLALYEQSGKGGRRRPCGCERYKEAEKEDVEDLVVVKDALTGADDLDKSL
jgi:hypothetical protein